MFTAKLELPLVRRVVRLGSWVIFAMLTQFFVNYFDTLMVGYLDGPVATEARVLRITHRRDLEGACVFFASARGESS